MCGCFRELAHGQLRLQKCTEDLHALMMVFRCHDPFFQPSPFGAADSGKLRHLVAECPGRYAEQLRQCRWIKISPEYPEASVRKETPVLAGLGMHYRGLVATAVQLGKAGFVMEHHFRAAIRQGAVNVRLPLRHTVLECPEHAHMAGQLRWWWKGYVHKVMFSLKLSISSVTIPGVLYGLMQYLRI